MKTNYRPRCHNPKCHKPLSGSLKTYCSEPCRAAHYATLRHAPTAY